MGRAYGFITALGPTPSLQRRAYFSSSSRRVLERQTALDFCISYQYVHEEHASKRQKWPYQLTLLLFICLLIPSASFDMMSETRTGLEFPIWDSIVWGQIFTPLQNHIPTWFLQLLFTCTSKQIPNSLNCFYVNRQYLCVTT